MSRRILFFFTILLLLLSACSDDRTRMPSPLPGVPTKAEATELPTEIPATETPLPTATLEPTPTEVANLCLECHVDKQRLIDTAKPEVVVESESKGVG